MKKKICETFSISQQLLSLKTNSYYCAMHAILSFASDRDVMCTVIGCNMIVICNVCWTVQCTVGCIVHTSSLSVIVGDLKK